MNKNTFFLINCYRLCKYPSIWIINKITRKLLNMKGWLLFKRICKYKTSNKVERSIGELRKTGFTILEQHFSHNQLSNICMKFDEIMANEEYLNISENDFDHQFKQRIVPIWVKFPEIASLVFDETLCEIICRYKGLIPGFQVSSYKTLPFSIPQGSSNFHQDQFGDFSIFIALENIDASNGASQYVIGSHQRIFSLWNYYFFKWLKTLFIAKKILPIPSTSYYYPENFVSKIYSRESWVRGMGLKGSVIFMDVSGIHRGPYWDKTSSISLARSRSVIHIAAREKVLIGKGAFKKQSMDHLQKEIPENSVWGNAVLTITREYCIP